MQKRSQINSDIEEKLSIRNAQSRGLYVECFLPSWGCSSPFDHVLNSDVLWNSLLHADFKIWIVYLINNKILLCERIAFSWSVEHLTTGCVGDPLPVNPVCFMFCFIGLLFQCFNSQVNTAIISAFGALQGRWVPSKHKWNYHFHRVSMNQRMSFSL